MGTLRERFVLFWFVDSGGHQRERAQHIQPDSSGYCQPVHHLHSQQGDQAAAERWVDVLEEKQSVIRADVLRLCRSLEFPTSQSSEGLLEPPWPHCSQPARWRPCYGTVRSQHGDDSDSCESGPVVRICAGCFGVICCSLNTRETGRNLLLTHTE